MKPPIADPTERPTLEGPDRVFYPSFWALFVRNLVIMHITMGVGLFLVVQPALTSARSNRGSLDFVLNVALIASPTLMALTETVSSVFMKALTVSPEGLATRGKWGRLRTLAWDDMRAVKRMWGLIPEIVITDSKKKPALTLLLLLRESDAFVRAVEKHTDVDHPLRVYLVERGY